MSVPVIAIDGPSASGKGTVAQRVASELGFHYLDSGAFYRLVALSALRQGVAWDQAEALGGIAARLSVEFRGDRVFLDKQDVTNEIRAEACSDGASRVATLPGVRDALLSRQRAFRQPPGLVADGRDMGSVVFTDATLKVFLTASAEARAERRYKQLIAKGIAATLSTLLQDLRERDARDAQRSVAPLKPPPGTYHLDTTAMSVEQAARQVLAWFRAGKHGDGATSTP